MAQKTTAYDLPNLLSKHQLTTYNREVSVSDDKTKKAVLLSAKENNGVAWIEGASLGDGTIDVDIKGKDVLQQSFVGIAFHGASDNTYDAVYFRPFNFRATDSVRHIHAVQYMSLPDYDWPKLRQEKNGQYEKAIIPEPDPNTWFHARIVVKYPQVTVYVNGQQTASLTVNKLNERKTGKIGLWVGHGSDGHFANLQVTQ